MAKNIYDTLKEAQKVADSGRTKKGVYKLTNNTFFVGTYDGALKADRSKQVRDDVMREIYAKQKVKVDFEKWSKNRQKKLGSYFSINNSIFTDIKGNIIK